MRTTELPGRESLVAAEIIGIGMAQPHGQYIQPTKYDESIILIGLALSFSQSYSPGPQCNCLAALLLACGVVLGMLLMQFKF